MLIDMRKPLSPRKRKIKIQKMFTNWINLLHGLPQGSILGPLLFIFFFLISFCLQQTMILKVRQMITFNLQWAAQNWK